MFKKVPRSILPEKNRLLALRASRSLLCCFQPTKTQLTRIASRNLRTPGLLRFSESWKKTFSSADTPRNGQIGVDSSDGAGSTFWFTAVLEKQTEGLRKEPVLPADIQGQRILVVNDNRLNRQIMSDQLKNWACFVDEAEGGEAVLSRLLLAAEGKAPFRLAIIDMMMPGMDGKMLGRKIKADLRITGTALVMLTSAGRRSGYRFFSLSHQAG